LVFYRACSEEEVNGVSIKQRKSKLKELEILRTGDDAAKAFKPLSEALFANS
jgi:hypothetical protein